MFFNASTTPAAPNRLSSDSEPQKLLALRRRKGGPVTVSRKLHAVRDIAIACPHAPTWNELRVGARRDPKPVSPVSGETSVRPTILARRWSRSSPRSRARPRATSATPAPSSPRDLMATVNFCDNLLPSTSAAKPHRDELLRGGDQALIDRASYPKKPVSLRKTAEKTFEFAIRRYGRRPFQARDKRSRESACEEWGNSSFVSCFPNLDPKQFRPG